MTQGLGEAAANLSWLSPCAASLVALTRSGGSEGGRAVWEEVRFDPGCVLLLIRHALPRGAPSGLAFFPALVRDPAPLEAAARQLAQPGPGFVDWDQPACRAVYETSLACARLAFLLAEKTECCDPDNAWAAGLLAPLGWLALCAAAPAAIRDPKAVSGFDPAALARRLSRFWELPAWLGAVTGHLGLPVEVARDLGADPGLFRVAQLAVGLAGQQGSSLALAVGAEPATLAAELGLSAAEVEELKGAAGRLPPRPLRWEPPASVALLPDLLRLAAENRRLANGPGVARLHEDIDALQRAVEGQRAGEAGRLQALKLRALAEFAAGAGHEINNPLAVISGQAQYLLGREADPARRRALQTVISQANRIHHTLTELMQFARPTAPKPQPVDVATLLREVADGLRDLAEQRQVRLLVAEPASPLAVNADPGQALVALRCLVRNALEAAPPEGWASVRAEAGEEAVEFVVEDSGAGPSAADREHFFDPFYSGRKAGRGRGLGLPTAWRLAREQGGDVHHEACGPGPTRFTLRLPRAPSHPHEAPHPASADLSEQAPGLNGAVACTSAPPAA